MEEDSSISRQLVSTSDGEVIAIETDEGVVKTGETEFRLRSLVPDATSEEETVFARHRDGVEDELGITRIFDWRKQDADDVADVIRDVDEEDVSNRWDEIASELIQRVNVATPPEYKDADEMESQAKVGG